jgi:poly [ADP-ribose] polymerase
MTAKPGKYMWLERDYNDEDDDDDNESKIKSDPKEKGKEKEEENEPEPNVKAPPEVQTLVQFIFNANFINAHLAEMNYDANKLPLGKLAKSTILNGFAVLKVGEQPLSRSVFLYVPDGVRSHMLTLRS